MPFAPTTQDVSGQIWGDAFSSIGNSIGGMIAQQKEEAKQNQANYDIVKFLAKKDPTILGENFDVQSLSPRQATSILQGIKSFYDYGKEKAYMDQVALARQQAEAAQQEDSQWMQNPLRSVPGFTNLFVDRKGTFHGKTPAGELFDIGDTPNILNALKFSGRGLSDIYGDPSASVTPPLQSGVAAPSAGASSVPATSSVSPELQKLIQRNQAEKTQEETAAKKNYDSLSAYINSLSSARKQEFVQDANRLQELQGALVASTQDQPQDIVSLLTPKQTAKRTNDQFKQIRSQMDALNKKHGGLLEPAVMGQITPPAAAAQPAPSAKSKVATPQNLNGAFNVSNFRKSTGR